MPIIYRYVTQVCRAFVNLFTTKAEREQRKAKMEGKLLKGGSEIDGRFVNFSLDRFQSDGATGIISLP